MIWTRIADFFSYDYNHDTQHAFIIKQSTKETHFLNCEKSCRYISLGVFHVIFR